jgi:hypothetical protein
VVLPPIAQSAHSHPFGLSNYTPIAGGAPGSADLGLNRQFWGFTTGSAVPWFNEHAPPNAGVYIHDTTFEAWNMLQRDGRSALTSAPCGRSAKGDFSIVHHELHMNEVDYQIWTAYQSPPRPTCSPTTACPSSRCTPTPAADASPAHLPCGTLNARPAVGARRGHRRRIDGTDRESDEIRRDGRGVGGMRRHAVAHHRDDDAATDAQGGADVVAMDVVAADVVRADVAQRDVQKGSDVIDAAAPMDVMMEDASAPPDAGGKPDASPADGSAPGDATAPTDAPRGDASTFTCPMGIREIVLPAPSRPSRARPRA